MLKQLDGLLLQGSGFTKLSLRIVHFIWEDNIYVPPQPQVQPQVQLQDLHHHQAQALDTQLRQAILVIIVPTNNIACQMFHVLKHQE